MIRLSLRSLFISAMTVLMLGTVGASKASADTFTLDVVFADALPAGNYGSVTLVVSGSDILVTVSLNDPYGFHDAGLTSFNFNGPAGLSVAAGNFVITNADGSTWTFQSPSDNADGAGNFQYGFECAKAANGCTGYPDTFAFKIIGQTNLSLFETTNSKASKVFFAVNVADQTKNAKGEFSSDGCTGMVGAGGAAAQGGSKVDADCHVPTTTTTVPEPASLFLLGSGLALAGYRFRRKGARKNTTDTSN